ncbi:MAG: tRNA 2-thiocytidine biosynthesis protein TtcA [Clostridia bacterium]|nr:tRNA 2-thiocytidine biosynthesis protein TtcA [Clostridia bacterium]
MENNNKRGNNLEKYKEIEKSIMTTYRKRIWNKFTKSIRDYDMIQDGDKIAVCISGGKDSFLMAKCFQELKRHGKINFEVVYMVMNPGYNEENKQKIISNAELLNIPITMFESNIFNCVYKIDNNPCYICARMRRGYLYKKARELGCNKIALGHHFDDVIETILMGMLYGSQIQTMMPKLHSTFHEGMELIRPLYWVKEESIISWVNRNNLEFLQCACRFTEEYIKNDNEDGKSKREEVKKLIKSLKQNYDNIDINIFRSVENVNLNTIISYKKDGKTHHFLDDYDDFVFQHNEYNDGLTDNNEE